MLNAPTNRMHGVALIGMLKLKPNKKDKSSKADPPMKHFNPVTRTMSRFFLRYLLRLLSSPQKKHAPIISKLPTKFSVNVRL